MRILFVSVPGLGHIHPMFPLATALRDDLGHDVRWAVDPDSAPPVEAAGFEVFRAGITEQDRFAKLVSLGKLPKGPMGPSPTLFAALFGEIGAPAMFVDLQQIASEWMPDLFVHNLNEFASAPVAASVARPHVTHGVGPLLPEGVLLAAAAEVAPLWQAVGIEPPALGGAFQNAFIDIYPPGLWPTREMPARHLALRPAAPDHDTAAPTWWKELADRPTIYLTFGTMSIFNGDPRLIQMGLDGLSDLNVNVVATTARDIGQQLAVPANALVLDYVPQASLLPRVAAVVSHGGSGTFLGALAHGLPQLCIPGGADQFLNARVAAESGVGLALMPPEFSREAVAESVRRILDEPGFQWRAAEVAQVVATMPQPVEVAAELERLFIANELQKVEK